MHRRVIYQALAWVPIAAGSATIAFTTTSHQVINKAVVYEPTTTYAQAIVAAAETITADKWYQPLATPVRRPPLGAARLNIVQTATPLAADIKADMWWRQLDLPVRRRQITAEEGSIFAAPARPEANDQQAWYRPLGEPQRIKRSLYAQLTSSYAYFLPVVAETITVDKWYRPLDLPMRERRRIADQQELAAPVVTPEAFPGNATIAFAYRPRGWSSTAPSSTKIRPTPISRRSLAWKPSPPTSGGSSSLSRFGAGRSSRGPTRPPRPRRKPTIKPPGIGLSRFRGGARLIVEGAYSSAPPKLHRPMTR